MVTKNIDIIHAIDDQDQFDILECKSITFENLIDYVRKNQL